MSWFGYKSKSGYAEGSHPARNTHSSVTGIKSRVDASYKHPTSHAKVDPSMEKYGRPREVEDFITKILDEVNGAPDLATSLNPDPNWGSHSSPVKLYPSGDHGYDKFSVKSKIFWYHGDPYDHADRLPSRVYDQPSQNYYDVPNDQYFDQSHMKLETSKDSEAPRQWERSQHPLYDPPSQHVLKDHGYPKNQWGNSSIEFHAPKDDEVRKGKWEKSSSHVYGDHFPKYQYAEMSKDHEGTNSRWHNSIRKPQSPSTHGTPSNHRLSSYDQTSPTRNGGGAPKNYGRPQLNYGLPIYQHERSSSPLHDHSSPNGYNAGVPNRNWGNSLMKPQSPKGHRAPNNQWERSSGRIHDHSPPTKSTSGVTGVPSNQWGNSLMKPQSPKRHGVASEQWDRSLSPIHNHTPPTTSTGGVTIVPSSRWGHSLMKPQSPKDHGVANSQWDRPNPVNDKPPPTKKTWGDPNAPSTGWGNNSSMKPQPPKDHEAFRNQWDRSSNPVHDQYPLARNTGEALNAPTSRWGNSLKKPQPSNDGGVPSNQWNRSSSPVHGHPSLAKITTGCPTRWDNNSMQPVSPKNHGAPNSQLDGPSNRSFVHDHPLPSTNKSGVPDNQRANSPTKSQSKYLKNYGVPNNQGNKQSSFVHGHPPLSGNIDGVPNKRWSDHPATPQSPKGYNQWNRSSSPVHDHSSPTRNTIGIPNTKLGNSSMKPQSPKKANNPYDEKTGNNNNNNNTHMNNHVGYSYDHQPEEYNGSNNGTKPNGYSNPPKMDPAGATLKSMVPDNLPDPRLKLSYPSSMGPKQESKVGLGFTNNAKAGKRYDWP